MPTYEYECDKCERHFCVHESISQHAEPKPCRCPNCGSTTVRQVITAPPVQASKKS